MTCPALVPLALCAALERLAGPDVIDDMPADTELEPDKPADEP